MEDDQRVSRAQEERPRGSQGSLDETSLALSYVNGEPVSRPGGFSDLLRSSLRSNGLTSVEVSYLEANLEPRSCRALATEAATFEGAMRLARMAGITSKVSQENFARCWYECIAAMEALEKRGSQQSLAELAEKKDFEACTEALMGRLGVQQKQDLLPLLRGMLGHLAERQRLASGVVPPSPSKVLSLLSATYGAEIAAKAASQAKADEAEWRRRWTVRALFSADVALALQKDVNTLGMRWWLLSLCAGCDVQFIS
ncbi:unnamed protein product [Polarella glacialis]|uniref:Uncharacterized protein n=2 Tax=Polarella glacialis TaxID=89957 RepID=A0A813EFJ6_POLGL|nr:unnamed protein product [Polarella glacialis]